MVALTSLYFRNESCSLSESEFRTIILDYKDKGYFVDHVFPSNIAMPALQTSFPLSLVLAGNTPSYDEFPELKGRAYVHYIVSRIVSGTEFEGRISINTVPKEGHINFYFLSKDEKRLSRNFTNNCTFIGLYRAVLCDASLIRSTFDHIDSIQELYDIAVITLDEKTREVTGIEQPDISTNPEMRKVLLSLMKGSVLAWILGHEIGHAMLHHELVMNECRELHFDLTYNKVEEEADSFVAEQAAKVDGRGAEMATLLGEFIEQEFRRHYLEDANTVSGAEREELRENDFVLKNKIRIEHGKYTVPLLIRALHVKRALLLKAPETGIIERYDTILKNIETNWAITGADK